jgi:hypothetical protein
MPRVRQPQPGDHVRVQFGPRIIEGTVLRVRGAYMTISVPSDETDEPIDRFVRTDALVSA